MSDEIDMRKFFAAMPVGGVLIGFVHGLHTELYRFDMVSRLPGMPFWEAAATGVFLAPLIYIIGCRFAQDGAIIWRGIRNQCMRITRFAF